MKSTYQTLIVDFRLDGHRLLVRDSPLARVHAADRLSALRRLLRLCLEVLLFAM